ncbi:flavodoxin family protein [Streptomyces johnsoniae]|uniref:NAD(P)H-dependent oxidoreductase n=1 Tax=Streptomyces johnsoniae TaxID=3075532 RepID=A0ABU2SE37_9ACTN|nr:NAD(P)H-dependent oxidoreductase [Streptomyces sp. DSM 41886]MDT0447157.1 NAD(P)H-dependent oxidoreductase [Streptomyces sp. DSM 41886]
MTKVAIIFHSRSGNTYQLAAAAADAAAKAGAETRLLKVGELPDPMVLDKEAYSELETDTADLKVATLEDLVWADAIMIGTPVHFGLPAPQIINFIDHSGPVAIPGKLVNKAVTVFASGSAPHSGAQTTILAVHNSLCHWGSLIVPNGSSVEILGSENNGSPYGTCSISRHEANNVHEDNLRAIEYQALRLVEVARAYQIGLQQTESAIKYVTLDDLTRKFPRLSMN